MKRKMHWINILVWLFSLILTIFATTDNENINFPLNCAERPFCKNLRTHIPTDLEKYVYDRDFEKDGTYLIYLKHSLNNNQLVVGIQSVENYQFRVIIEEPHSHRYKLQYVLEREPSYQRLNSVDKGHNEIVLGYEEDKSVRIQLSPLKIEFYYGTYVQTVITGERLIMENTNVSQSFAFEVQFPQSQRLIGLHEHADYFNLRHTAGLSIDPYRLKNIDYGYFQYDTNSTKAMYGSVPLLYGFGSARTSAIFVHNAAEMFIDINRNNQSAYFMVEGGRMDLFVLLGPSLKHAVRQYMNLTGKPHLPQRWALGYHQCRVSYENTSDVKNVITKFDENRFPLDSMWLVRVATDNQRWFMWNKKAFPDITELFRWGDEHAQRKFTAMTESNIKIDSTYKLYTEGLANGYFVKEANGSNFINICWAGRSTWVDFFNPKALDWYSKQYLYTNFEQTRTLAGTWNDMGEPAIFDNNVNERTMPDSLVHNGSIRHRDVHNAYGLMQVVASHKGLILRDNGTMRPFILTRAGFAGTQRYALKWSGDNIGRFDNLQFSVPMTMVANLAGISFYGADIPGFKEGANEELTIRWYQVGAWIPFYRAHAQSGPRREPYTFKNDTQKLLRDAMYWRYKHIFYWYTLFFEHTVTGDPLIRPLLYDYPTEEQTHDLNDQFLVGSDILVSSVSYSKVSEVKVYLPGEKHWVQVLDGSETKVFKGGNWYNIPVDMSFIPIFYREGSVIPRYDNETRSTANMSNTISIHVVLGDNNRAEGRIYVDDNESFNYRQKRHYLYLNITVSLTNEHKYMVSVRDLSESSVKNDLEVTIEKLVVYKVSKNENLSKKIVLTHTREGISLHDVTINSNTIITL